MPMLCGLVDVMDVQAHEEGQESDETRQNERLAQGKEECEAKATVNAERLQSGRIGPVQNCCRLLLLAFSQPHDSDTPLLPCLLRSRFGCKCTASFTRLQLTCVTSTQAEQGSKNVSAAALARLLINMWKWARHSFLQLAGALVSEGKA
jgi:hypothetical protein